MIILLISGESLDYRHTWLRNVTIYNVFVYCGAWNTQLHYHCSFPEHFHGKWKLHGYIKQMEVDGSHIFSDGPLFVNIKDITKTEDLYSSKQGQRADLCWSACSCNIHYYIHIYACECVYISGRPWPWLAGRRQYSICRARPKETPVNTIVTPLLKYTSKCQQVKQCKENVKTCPESSTLLRWCSASGSGSGIPPTHSAHKSLHTNKIKKQAPHFPVKKQSCQEDVRCSYFWKTAAHTL